MGHQKRGGGGGAVQKDVEIYPTAHKNMSESSENIVQKLLAPSCGALRNTLWGDQR